MSLRKKIAVLACCLSGLFLAAQPGPNARELFLADSLRQILASATNDSIKFDLRYHIEEYSHNERVSYWDSFALEARTKGLNYAECIAQNKIGFYSYQIDGIKSTTAFEKAFSLAEKHCYYSEMPLMGYNLASVYNAKGNTEKAIKYAFKALIMADKVKDERMRGSIYTLIGMMYWAAGDYQKALAIHLKSLDAARASGDPERISSNLCFVGSDYAHLNKYAEATRYYLESVKYADKLSPSITLFDIYNSTGCGYEMQKNFVKADFYYNKAYSVGLLLKRSGAIASVVFQMASSKFNAGNNNEARVLAERSLKIADSMGFKAQVIGATGLLKKIYLKDKNYARALEVFERHISMKDSISSEKERKKILEKEFAFKLEKKENENELLEQKNQIQTLQLNQNRYLVYGLGAVLLLLLLTGFLFFRQNKFKVERQSIQLQQKLLRSQMDPHFIFNALNSINQFILSNENEKAQVYLTRFSTLIRRLLESSTAEVISIREETVILEKYLEIESLRFGNVFSYKITVNENCDPFKTDIPHFLVQPFIENAIWHGLLPKAGQKHLDVVFEQANNHLIRCTIDDNGVGRKAKPEENGEKDKRSLAIAFIKQRLEILGKMKKVECGVEITDKKNEDGEALGTRVVVTIPIM